MSKSLLEYLLFWRFCDNVTLRQAQTLIGNDALINIFVVSDVQLSNLLRQPGIFRHFNLIFVGHHTFWPLYTVTRCVLYLAIIWLCLLEAELLNMLVLIDVVKVDQDVGDAAYPTADQGQGVLVERDHHCVELEFIFDQERRHLPFSFAGGVDDADLGQVLEEEEEVS